MHLTEDFSINDCKNKIDLARQIFYPSIDKWMHDQSLSVTVCTRHMYKYRYTLRIMRQIYKYMYIKKNHKHALLNIAAFHYLNKYYLISNYNYNDFAYVYMSIKRITYLMLDYKKYLHYSFRYNFYQLFDKFIWFSCLRHPLHTFCCFHGIVEYNMSCNKLQ